MVKFTNCCCGLSSGKPNIFAPNFVSFDISTKLRVFMFLFFSHFQLVVLLKYLKAFNRVRVEFCIVYISKSV